MENASGPRADKTLPTPQLCHCGKPVTHLTASEESTDWACRVPNYDPATGRICPSWCLRHEDADVGRPDAFRMHRGPIHFGGDISVQVEALEWLATNRMEPTTILLNGNDITADVAQALSVALLLAVAEAGQ